MKKIYFIFSIMVVAMVLVTSCKKDIIMFDDSTALVGFASTSLVISEADADPSDITLYLGGALGATTDIVLSTSIERYNDPEGFNNPAIEGTDFTLSSMSVSMEVGETVIQITPVDNAIFEGTKKFDLVITSNTAGYDISAESVLAVTIDDNEHPLKAWIGTYDIDAQSYGDPDNWDEAWVVTTSPVEGNLDQLSMVGFGDGGTGEVIAEIDTDAMTITIAPGQDSDAYASSGYTEGYVFFGFSDLSLDKDAALTGTIALDGTIVIDNFAISVWYNGADYGVWDSWHTTWTLQ